MIVVDVVLIVYGLNLFFSVMVNLFKYSCAYSRVIVFADVSVDVVVWSSNLSNLFGVCLMFMIFKMVVIVVIDFVCNFVLFLVCFVDLARVSKSDKILLAYGVK